MKRSLLMFAAMMAMGGMENMGTDYPVTSSPERKRKPTPKSKPLLPTLIENGKTITGEIEIKVSDVNYSVPTELIFTTEKAYAKKVKLLSYRLRDYIVECLNQNVPIDDKIIQVYKSED